MAIKVTRAAELGDWLTVLQTAVREMSIETLPGAKEWIATYWGMKSSALKQRENSGATGERGPKFS